MTFSFSESLSYDTGNNQLAYQTDLQAQDSSRLVGYSSVQNDSSNPNPSGSAAIASTSYAGYSTENTLNPQISGDLLTLTNTSLGQSFLQTGRPILSTGKFSTINSQPYLQSLNIEDNTTTTKSSTVQNAGYLSEIEQAILRSQVPININETEEITVLGQRGLWTNKQEVVNWRGTIPITEYQINEDQNPEIITKKTQQTLSYIQELAIRYLKPPTPPAPGEIIITQDMNSMIPPAPPLIIRQQPVRPNTPEPLVIREAPPQPPPQVGRKVITISGKRLPPPPRKVVIERLAPLPSKPQSVIIERWLPYSQVKRRVIYQRSNENDAFVVKPRNVIVQWEAPQVQIKKDFKYLGIIRANPVEYVQRYGPTLKTSRELPDFVLDIKPPQGVILAADYQYNQVHELEGELQALKFVDLDREGLSEYRPQLERLEIKLGNNNLSKNEPSIIQSNQFTYSTQQFLNQQLSGAFSQPQTRLQSTISVGNNNSNFLDIISDIFAQIDRDQNGTLTVDEAEKLFLKLNSRLCRSYSDDDIRRFFQVLDINNDNTISLSEFKRAFENLL